MNGDSIEAVTVGGGDAGLIAALTLDRVAGVDVTVVDDFDSGHY